MRTRSRLITASAAALLALTALAGCTATNASYEPSSGHANDSAYADGGGSAAAAPGAPTVVDDRALVTTGQMGIETPDVAAATEQVQGIVAEHGGRIDARSEQTGGYSYSMLTVRVPADDYEGLVESLRGIGTVKYVETSVVDVTLETVDLEARISSLEASVASLRTMLAQATNVSDMLEVETTLSEREAELQSLKAQQSALAEQVAMSTLTVNLSNDELANPPANEGGFLGGLQAGWNALMSFFNGLLTLLGFILPGVIVLGLIGLMVFAIVYAAIRSRRSSGARAGTPVTAGAADATAAPFDPQAEQHAAPHGAPRPEAPSPHAQSPQPAQPSPERQPQPQPQSDRQPASDRPTPEINPGSAPGGDDAPADEPDAAQGNRA